MARGDSSNRSRSGASGARGGFLLFTSRGSLSAREALVATNGYTANAVKPLRQGIFPIGSYIITTAPLPAALQQEISLWCMFF